MRSSRSSRIRSSASRIRSISDARRLAGHRNGLLVHVLLRLVVVVRVRDKTYATTRLRARATAEERHESPLAGVTRPFAMAFGDGRTNTELSNDRPRLIGYARDYGQEYEHLHEHEQAVGQLRAWCRLY